VVEEPRSEDVEEPEKCLLPMLSQPDEHRWWELQLGLPLPNRLYTESSTGP
jgi:hypothetical protein